MPFGGKYVTKYNDNPGPGELDLDSAMKHVKPKTFEPFIGKEEKSSPFKVPKKGEANPEPGAYHKNEPFGSGIKTKVGMGAKYEFKPDKNPPVGGYDIDRARN